MKKTVTVLTSTFPAGSIVGDGQVHSAPELVAKEVVVETDEAKHWATVLTEMLSGVHATNGDGALIGVALQAIPGGSLQTLNARLATLKLMIERTAKSRGIELTRSL